MIQARKVLREVLLSAALCALMLLAASSAASASEYRGVVSAGGLPVPGATVTVTQGGKKFVTVTDMQGFYIFPELADGAATVQVQMTGYAALDAQPVTVSAETVLGKLELTLLSLDQMIATLKPVMSAGIAVTQARIEPRVTGEAPKPAAGQPAPPPPSDETAQRAADGLLINGSVNNAATSQFSLGPRFGNTASGKSLYSFSLNAALGNSAFDATSYSITGTPIAKPEQDRLTFGFAVQGPLKIPHLLRNGPNIFVGYQRTRNSVAISTPGLVPTLMQRAGDLSQTFYTTGQTMQLVQIYNPATGLPYPGNKVPVSPQAQALLALYPLPNLTPLAGAAGSTQYNYQVPLVTDTHTDSLNSNANKTVGRNNQFSGGFAFTSTRNSSANLLNFVDATQNLGLSANVNWSHTFNVHTRMNLGYQFSRQSNRSTPYFQSRANISGQAGITGNAQDVMDWGPPALNFSSGISSLYDGVSSFNRNETNGVSYRVTWSHSAHNVTAGVDLRRQQFNYLAQSNPRGNFSFTGTATGQPAASSTQSTSATSTGSDLADFLIGVPDASAIAFGNPDKYLRQLVTDAYVNDDWRVNPQLTVNGGVRWEYSSPVTELKNRLVNIDAAPNFTAVAPVLAGSPVGAITGASYPSSLLRPVYTGVEPRLGISYRPLPGSSLLVTAGYGLTYDTSIYQGIALQMAQQAPLSKSLTVQNSATCPLTLANGFVPCSAETADTFGIDPNYRIGYVHTWSLRVQRDLPGSLQMVATYLGIKGTRGAQEFLPNTNAPGATNPCPSCPSGFKYLTSTGNSTRESGQLQLRRRLHSGLTASVTYTYSKSIDDDSALGGQGAATSGSATLAQDWRNLRGERGLSTFDQRHLVSALAQYTTGMGMAGGTLMSGWRGKVYKGWTLQTQFSAGTGLPETPILTSILVAGYSSSVRPSLTGASIYAPPTGHFLNPSAYTAPAAGLWGNARRDSITGPNQFTLNSAMVRTFQITPKVSLDAQIAASNALNHVTFTSYVANVNSTQFGLPTSANGMRAVQLSGRLRF